MRRHLVQTFLPYPDYVKCAEVLDNRRLHKQIVEAYQILNGTGWLDHPVTKMWKNHGYQLIQYSFAMCDEYEVRYGNQMLRNSFARLLPLYSDHGKPWWLGDERLHQSHRSNLVRKNPAHYGFFWPDVPPDLEYWWPER